MSKEENKKLILRQLAAITSLKTRGLEYACKAYPEDVNFLLENKEKNIQEVISQSSHKLKLD